LNIYNSWRHKWPGRVGDSPLVGSGLYCDGNVGAAVATGDGEEVCAFFYQFAKLLLILST
jgi:N4-(beta-N-acetylglucosaminyl)-L-asparaginase